MSRVDGALPTSQRLLGKVVLITGAGGAIGSDTACRLLSEGANLSLVDRSEEALDVVLGKLTELVPAEEMSRRVVTTCADATSESQVQQYTTRTLERFGRLDCAWLNAGMSYNSTSLFETTEQTYDLVMQVNVKSAFLGIKHAAKAMRDTTVNGSIILTSSIAGLRGTPGLILYSGSKFALRGLALTAASELGVHGIRVNTIHPSGVNTPMFTNAWSPEKIDELRKAVPLGRIAETSDIAGVVAFLVSDDSQFMTGGLLKVDGGSMSF